MNNARRRARNYGATKVPIDQSSSIFKKALDSFTKIKKGLANSTLDGMSLNNISESTKPIGYVQENFRVEFSSRRRTYKRPENSKILTKEVENVKLGWSHLAPGNDRIIIAQVKQINKEILVAAYSVFLHRNLTPKSWRDLRTVLISKTVDSSHLTN